MAIASGGGHWVQLRRIMPAFAGLEVFYVSVDPSSATDVPGCTYYAIRDVSRRDRLGFALLVAQLARILARERPDVVITTGSAPCLVALGLAKAFLRARTIWIELDRQRRAAVVLGPAGAAGRRRLADPVAAPRPPRRPRLLGIGAVIFVTIGSMFPFDRLIRVMDAWAAAHGVAELLAQIGDGAYQPAHMPWVRRLDQAAFARTVAGARLIVAHAGMGSVITADEFAQADRDPAAAAGPGRAHHRPPGRHRQLAARQARDPRRRPRRGSRAAHRRGAGGRRARAALRADRRARVHRPHPAVHPELEGSMVKIGIAGLGKMGLSHFAIVNSHPETEVVVCDASKLVLDVVGRYTDVPVFRDYDAMLAAGLDAVIVATPSRLHAPMVQKALERGLHVFCEKPFCLDWRESEELAGLAAARGLVNQVGYHYRYAGAFREMKRLVEAGAIGRITHVLAEAYGPVVLKRQGSTWRTERTEGGGCLYDYAAHPINLVNWLFGLPDAGVGHGDDRNLLGRHRRRGLFDLRLCRRPERAAVGELERRVASARCRPRSP